MNTDVSLESAAGALAPAGGVGIPLDRPLRPGESYTTEQEDEVRAGGLKACAEAEKIFLTGR